MISFQAKYLPALAKFMAHNDIRYYLCGVFIQPNPEGGAFLVATDGRTMLVIKDATAVCSEPTIFAVSPDALRHCAPKRPTRKSRLTVMQNPTVTINTITGRLTVMRGTEELFLQPGKCVIEGKFPDWRRVIPPMDELNPGSVDALNAAYVSKACSIAPKPDGSHLVAAVRLWQVREHHVTVVQHTGAPEYLGLIMPIREGDDTNGIWKTNFAGGGAGRDGYAAVDQKAKEMSHG